MKLVFSKDEQEALQAINIAIKEEYSDDDLLSMEEKVGEEVLNHFDDNDNPLPRALLYESILDKISEV